MISTGFKALDRVIGGLKEGKLYALATFNFDHGTAKYFALNMIANIQRPAFFHSGLMESARMTASAFAEWSLFILLQRKKTTGCAGMLPNSFSFKFKKVNSML